MDYRLKFQQQIFPRIFQRKNGGGDYMVNGNGDYMVNGNGDYSMGGDYVVSVSYLHHDIKASGHF